jgi:hypothetical protein
MLEMALLSYASDDAIEVTWSWRDVDAGSCRRECCRVMLVTALTGRLGHGEM